MKSHGVEDTAQQVCSMGEGGETGAVIMGLALDTWLTSFGAPTGPMVAVLHIWTAFEKVHEHPPFVVISGWCPPNTQPVPKGHLMTLMLSLL